MRILWHSNAPWANTGYGVQTKFATDYIPTLGHDLAISSNFGLRGGPIGVGKHNVPIFPAKAEQWGNDVIDSHARHFKADLIITLFDAWVMEAGGWSTPWAAHLPVDHYPAPPVVIEALGPARWVIPYSLFGMQALQDAGIEDDRLRYVPHGIDVDVYTPQGKRVAREKMDLPDDKFIVGFVGANKGWPSRKSIPELLEAFAAFHSDYPDTLLYLHTQITEQHGGIDILRLANAVGLDGDSFIIADQDQLHRGLPAPVMAMLYSAFDVLANPSMGEGFGIPIMEAQACGTPVIATAFTAMTELVAGGWLMHNYALEYTQQGSFQARIDADELADYMASAFKATYDDAPEMKKRSLAAREMATNYHYPTITERYWSPVLAEIAASLDVA